jgi:hypothetical protein
MSVVNVNHPLVCHQEVTYSICLVLKLQVLQVVKNVCIVKQGFAGPIISELGLLQAYIIGF